MVRRPRCPLAVDHCPPTPSYVCAPRPEFVAVSRTPAALVCRARGEFNMRTNGVR
jgi:hypothetical protein